VDEVLFLEDGTAAPLDYKFAEFKDKLYRTHRYQSALYGLMIADTYDVAVKKVKLGEKDFERAIELVDVVLGIKQHGFYPKATGYKTRCVDCTSRNSCE
jgi:CRISPR-associated exonuclease Cas4